MSRAHISSRDDFFPRDGAVGGHKGGTLVGPISESLDRNYAIMDDSGYIEHSWMIVVI